MFRGGISQVFRNGSDASGVVREKDGGSGHAGFCLFLLEVLPIVLGQQTLGLPGT